MTFPKQAVVLMGELLLLTLPAQVGFAVSSPTDVQLRDVIERIIAGEAGSDMGCEVSRLDVDDDGAQEALVRFPVGAHGSQTRVIRWERGKERVLYDGGCDTPNADFVLVNGTPAVILEYSDYQPSYRAGKRMQRLHLWNGETFVYDPRLDCLLEQITIEANGESQFVNTADHCLPKREPIASAPCSTLR